MNVQPHISSNSPQSPETFTPPFSISIFNVSKYHLRFFQNVPCEKAPSLPILPLGNEFLQPVSNLTVPRMLILLPQSLQQILLQHVPLQHRMPQMLIVIVLARFSEYLSHPGRVQVAAAFHIRVWKLLWFLIDLGCQWGPGLDQWVDDALVAILANGELWKVRMDMPCFPGLHLISRTIINCSQLFGQIADRLGVWRFPPTLGFPRRFHDHVEVVTKANVTTTKAAEALFAFVMVRSLCRVEHVSPVWKENLQAVHTVWTGIYTGYMLAGFGILKTIPVSGSKFISGTCSFLRCYLGQGGQEVYVRPT